MKFLPLGPIRRGNLTQSTTRPQYRGARRRTRSPIEKERSDVSHPADRPPFIFFVFVFPENEAHLRKKQRQSERLNSFMNKYKATLDKSGTAVGSINGAKPAQPPSLKSDVYTFTPQDFKYENKHYKYIKYTKYNKVSASGKFTMNEINQ